MSNYDFIDVVRECVENKDVGLFFRWYRNAIPRAIVKALYRTPLAKHLEIEALFRREYAAATASGADMWCMWHHCDARKCPDDGVHDGV